MRTRDALIASTVALLVFGTVFTGLSAIRGEFRDNTVDMYRDYDSGEGVSEQDFALPDPENEAAPPPPTSAPSAEAPIADGAYVLRPAHSLKCLAGEIIDDRRLLVQRTCTDEDDENALMPTIQVADAGGGTYTLLLADSGGLCLTVDYGIGEQGRLIGQQECNPGLYHQRYILEAVDTPVTGGFQIRPEHSDLCLTVPKGSTKSKVALVQSSCDETAAHQEFMVDPAIV